MESPGICYVNLRFMDWLMSDDHKTSLARAEPSWLRG